MKYVGKSIGMVAAVLIISTMTSGCSVLMAGQSGNYRCDEKFPTEDLPIS